MTQNGLRIAVNALGARMGGAATQMPNLLRALARLEGVRAILVLSSTSWEGFEPLPQNVGLLPVPGVEGYLGRILWQESTLPRLLSHWGADVLLSTGNFASFRARLPQVVMVHNALYFSKIATARYPARQRWTFHILRQGVCLSVRSASRVIVPSASMARALTDGCVLAGGKVRVVPHGADHAEPRAMGTWTPDGGAILYPSHHALHKNFDTLLAGYRFLVQHRGAPPSLLLTIESGDSPWAQGTLGQIDALGLGSFVRVIGRLPQPDLMELVATARAVVFPSWCESFGLPLAEAMRLGVPIVAADTEINREVCGQAALYFSVFDAADLANQLERLLGDPGLARALGEEGRHRASGLTWRRTAEQVVDVLLEAVEGS